MALWVVILIGAMFTLWISADAWKSKQANLERRRNKPPERNTAMTGPSSDTHLDMLEKHVEQRLREITGVIHAPMEGSPPPAPAAKPDPSSDTAMIRMVTRKAEELKAACKHHRATSG